MTRLHILDLSSNSLVGEIPKDLGKLKSLLELSLYDNHLVGNIPQELGTLSDLSSINVAGNNLSGSIPKQLGECSKLQFFNLSRNGLGRSIPVEISNLQSLQILDLSRNLLTGEIPRQLGLLHKLETLNLSHNQLSGSIESTFDDMASLTSIDISYNELEGALPNIPAFRNATIEVVRGNKGLCGVIAGLNPCATTRSKGKNNNKKLLLILVPTLACLLSLLLVVGGSSIVRRRVRKTEASSKDGTNENPWAILSFDGGMVYESIIEATEEFDPKYCIGVGGHGSVYKAQLQTGEILAVKKLKEAVDVEIANRKAFEREIHALTETRHRNIVKLYGFCLSSRHSFLVYEFLECGSLKDVLNNEERITTFDWKKRLNVVKGVAYALCYMHHECSPPIIHRDISSKNVLLDAEYEAHVSDFGTAKVLQPYSSNWTSFAGTFGYAAPASWPLKEVLDQRIPYPEGDVLGEVAFVTKMAFSCLSPKPEHRPSMQQVSQAISAHNSIVLSASEDIKLEELLDPTCFTY
ncbi:MDIS1-interacting receptor like kinase 2-like isoform X2 [Rhodamnia argentea]|uniref:non-specific serine/threonine protein kinase n=1 Tax=Rhodamnia argentea TaxID=178133 RepID=A0ABM3H0N6_9MYRT|nr:MDIS1-interacting receptor like kinase 2-like isoform X2 [Rhodamnia argentea]